MQTTMQVMSNWILHSCLHSHSCSCKCRRSNWTLESCFLAIALSGVISDWLPSQFNYFIPHHRPIRPIQMHQTDCTLTSNTSSHQSELYINTSTIKHINPINHMSWWLEIDADECQMHQSDLSDHFSFFISFAFSVTKLVWIYWSVI